MESVLEHLDRPQPHDKLNQSDDMPGFYPQTTNQQAYGIVDIKEYLIDPLKKNLRQKYFASLDRKELHQQLRNLQGTKRTKQEVKFGDAR